MSNVLVTSSATALSRVIESNYVAPVAEEPSAPSAGHVFSALSSPTGSRVVESSYSTPALP